jgi:hypothetical protein
VNKVGRYIIGFSGIIVGAGVLSYILSTLLLMFGSNPKWGAYGGIIIVLANIPNIIEWMNKPPS